jgi:hypothetical protein
MIRYSGGTIVDTLYTSDGTKSQMISQITSALIAASWTSLGSSIYESATTPGGFKIRVDVIDTGGLCVHLRLRTPTLVNVGSGDGAFLFPVNTRAFRIMANKYQLFHFTFGPVFTNDPSDLAFGVPYTPPFFTVGAGVIFDSYCGWMASNGVQNPGGGSNGNNSGGFHGRFPFMSGGGGNFWMWDGVSFFSIGTTGLTNIVAQESNTNPTGSDRTGLWADGSTAIYEPYIVWVGGHSTSGNWSVPTRHGQLWDAVILAAPLPTETLIVFDDKQWRNITHGNDYIDTGGPQIIPHSILLLSSP